MATIKAVKDTAQDPKAGKPRPRSSVSFPYYDLDQSVEVAKLMHEKAGGLCDRAQLAALLGYSGTNNGSFLTRLSSTKNFGLVEDTDDGKLRVTARGRAIIAPVSTVDAARARVDAFMAVDLFKRVFDQYNGSTLPEIVGLRNLLEHEYGVVPKQVVPAVRVLLDSAEQAGLFTAAGNRTRMVMPFLATYGTPTTPPAPASPTADAPAPRHGGGDGGGGDGLEGVDPAIVGLLRKLPPPGTAMSPKRRKVMIDAFTNVMAVVYPEPEGDQDA